MYFYLGKNAGSILTCFLIAVKICVATNGLCIFRRGSVELRFFDFRRLIMDKYEKPMSAEEIIKIVRQFKGEEPLGCDYDEFMEKVIKLGNEAEGLTAHLE
jgi:hypothetical protein